MALFTVDRADGPSPLTVNFDASSSYSSDGTIDIYSWKSGDGSSPTGVTALHAFTATTAKTYAIRLTVTNDCGKSATISATALPGGTTLFFDDFEDGVDKHLSLTTGNWEIVDGEIHPTSEDASAYVVNGENWENAFLGDLSILSEQLRAGARKGLSRSR